MESVDQAPDLHGVQRSVRGRRRRGGRGRLARGSRRGGSRGRGASRANSRDPSRGWRVTSTECENIMLPDTFFDALVSERARLFCLSALSRLDVECAVRETIPSRTGCVVLLSKDALIQCMNWLNERITLKFVGRQNVTLPEMYRFLAVLVASHATGLSYEKTIEILSSLGGFNSYTGVSAIYRF